MIRFLNQMQKNGHLHKQFLIFVFLLLFFVTLRLGSCLTNQSGNLKFVELVRETRTKASIFSHKGTKNTKGWV
jgi:hypothetical protein